MERTVLVLTGLVALAGCSMAPYRGVPGSSEPAAGGSGSTHRVEFAVRCDRCSAVFTTDDGTDLAEVEGFFQRTVTITSRGGRLVSLNVSIETGRVHEASISVDGEVVAVATDRDLFGGTGATLTAAVGRWDARLWVP